MLLLCSHATVSYQMQSAKPAICAWGMKQPTQPLSAMHSIPFPALVMCLCHTCYIQHPSMLMHTKNTAAHDILAAVTVTGHQDCILCPCLPSSAILVTAANLLPFPFQVTAPSANTHIDWVHRSYHFPSLLRPLQLLPLLLLLLLHVGFRPIFVSRAMCSACHRAMASRSREVTMGGRSCTSSTLFQLPLASNTW